MNYSGWYGGDIVQSDKPSTTVMTYWDRYPVRIRWDYRRGRWVQDDPKPSPVTRRGLS